MRKRKYRLPGFVFYDRTGLQIYLEKQARKGWLLDEIDAFGWRFRRIEPSELHFSVTYFPGAAEYDPLPDHKENLFREYCAHAGWQLAASNSPLQIFYNEQEDPVPINTDPDVELETIHRTARKGALPAYGILLVIGLWLLTVLVRDFRDELIVTLSNDFLLLIPVLPLLGSVLMAAQLARYYIWRYRAMKYARQTGELLSVRSHRGLASLLRVLVGAVILAAACSSGGIRGMLVVPVVMVWLHLLYLAIQGIRKLLLRREVSATANLVISAIAALILINTVGSMGLNLALHAIDGVFPPEKEPKLYIINNMRLELHEEEIPMTLADLGVELSDPVEVTGTYQSVLLSRTVCMEGTMEERFQKSLFYTVIDVKYDWLMDLVLEDLQDPENVYNGHMVFGCHFHSLQAMESASWGADAAWQGFDSEGEPLAVYLLRYGNRIVTLSLDEEMTVAQMAVVGEIFG